MSELEQTKAYLRSMIDAMNTLPDNEIAQYKREALEDTLKWIEENIERKG